ncbi:nucleotidyltransferase [Chitinophagaceae bacterium IBVUCB1]|jgi:uncharacterized protein|nr:nucleotidyltransferase [Chitinophagaceae bacterium IBVUCB1]
MRLAVDNKASLIALLHLHKDSIKSYGVRQLGLFGSFVRDNRIDNDSDIDLLVDFEKGKKTFDNFMNLSFYLENIFGRKVELVTHSALSPYIGKHILNEVENVNL